MGRSRLLPPAAGPLLDRTYRRARIIGFLQGQASTTDVFALQETTLQWGVMDHVIVRGGTPSTGTVYDFDQFVLYPNDQDARIVQNLKDCGSDHYPVAGVATR